MLDDHNAIKKYPLKVAEKDDTLYFVGSTYSHENHTIYDGLSRSGARVVTFAPILKHKIFALPEILDTLLELGSWGMGAPVEIEFAVNMKSGGVHEFGLLQMRPMVLKREKEILSLENFEDEKLVCRSPMVMGNGIIDELYDIVYVDIRNFERGKSLDAAREIDALNSKLLKMNRPYLLIGIGRWGSSDPWLGIPVVWDQISGAKAIVETNYKDFVVTPSQGSHFFQNLTSFMVGYFTVNDHKDEGFIDWEWLHRQEADEERNYTRHIKLEKPVVVKMNGQKNEGIILKPKM